MTGAEILDLPMSGNDADAKTIRDYLKALLENIWAEGESFSGKRPFGNSGWEYELVKPLVAAGIVKGTIDEYGDLYDEDFTSANEFIFRAIYAL